MQLRKRWKVGVAAVAALGALAGGGAAFATSVGDDHPVGGAAAGKARAAAVAYLGAGRAGSVELDGEHGATYDVEVHRADGTTVDVWLDDGFTPIASELDSEG
jgi:hypothetical protein